MSGASGTRIAVQRDALRVINPATLEPVGSVAVTDVGALDDIFAEARVAQRRCAALAPRERASLLRRVAAMLLASADRVAATIVAETGKPLAEAYTSELFVSLDHLTWLARNAERQLRPERVPLRNPAVLQKRARVRFAPVGVVAIVSPWNFPLGVALTQTATAVAAGNAVVLKPSEHTPLTGSLVAELFSLAGAPAGLVTVVHGTGELLGDAVVTHRATDRIVFTGSTETGRAIAARAAERLVPAVLELGGKDPMLVLDDADIDRAADGALWGAFTNCGQVCSGIERVYVAATVHDRFVERLVAGATQLRTGRGDDPQVDLGPMVTEAHRARVEALVADATEHGASLATGGGRPANGLPGWFHQPTVLLGEPAHARLVAEEIFGPVVTVVRIDNEADAIAAANRSRFALGASVWTTDVRRGQRIAEQLEAGSVWLNDHAYSYGVGQAPWGGRKDSGLGRTHARHGLHAMTNITYTDSDRGRLRPAWWYPYSGTLVDGLQGALHAAYGRGVGARLHALAAHRRGVAELARRATRR